MSKPEVGNQEGDQTQLRPQLTMIEAAALSVAIMAPTAAMALNGSLTASIAGTAVVLAFVLAFVTIALVSYAFIEFAKQYAAAGSVYSFNSRAMGARAGFLSGWALLLTYLAFTIASAGEVGLFFETFTGLLGWNVAWIIPALVALAVVAVLGIRRISLSTRVTLIVEGLSVLAILVLVVLIAAKVGVANFTFAPFRVGEAGISNVALASVFAFLSFAGFEGAAVLGEETADPRRSIPRAIRTAVGTVGVFYLVVIYFQAVGFGLDKGGVAAFAGSTGPLSDLASTYSGTSLAVLIAAGATVSAFASALGTATGATRLLFALGRDNLLPGALGRVDESTGAPRLAMALTITVGVVGNIVLYLAGVSAGNVFAYLGTVGVLALLVVYLATQVGAMVLFRRNGRWRVWQFAIPVLAILLLANTLYRNVFPIPAAPYNLFPYVVIVWIVVGVAISYARPAQMRAVAAELENEPA